MGRCGQHPLRCCALAPGARGRSPDHGRVRAGGRGGDHGRGCSQGHERGFLGSSRSLQNKIGRNYRPIPA